MSKIKNAHKRFRQGRTTYKKLKALVNEELAKNMKDIQDLEAKFKDVLVAPEEHVHETEEHVHGEDCHEHGQ